MTALKTKADLKPYADGFGEWHVKVSKTYTKDFALSVAKNAILGELVQRSDGTDEAAATLSAYVDEFVKLKPESPRFNYWHFTERVYGK